MELTQLTTFAKVAEFLSFSKAAQALGYSQSAVTIQIKQLESELQVTLFDRIGKQVSLTSEGITLLHYATDILARVNEAQLVLNQSNSPSGSLCIGASESLCTYLLPSILAKYHADYPNVVLSLKTGTTSELLNFLNQNQVDIVCLFSEKSNLTTSQLLFEKPEPFVFVTSPHHPISQLQTPTLLDLEKENFLLTESGCSYRNLLEHVFAEHQLTLHPLLEIGNTEVIKRCLAQGLGIALLPYFTVSDECIRHELQLLDISSVKIHLYHQLICHKHKYISSTLSAFIELYITSLTTASH